MAAAPHPAHRYAARIVGAHHVELVMGMAVSIDVRGDVGPDAIDDVVTWLHHVDDTFSTHKPDSPISRYGHGTLAAAEVTDEILEVLERCEALVEHTSGAFDAWAVVAPNGSRFDPSGLVKGWAIERAAQRLEAHGVTDLCINAGGDVALRGRPEPGRSWRVGIRHPQHPHLLAATLELHGRAAVATSATYERGAHIVDPGTGRPAAGIASATIVGVDLTDVDAAATAVFVMGVGGLDWLQRHHPDHAGFVITHDGTTLATPNLATLDPAGHSNTPAAAISPRRSSS